MVRVFVFKLQDDDQMNQKEPENKLDIPPPPERPDCCGGGCAICVLEDYFDEVQAWEREVEKIEARANGQEKKPGSTAPSET